MKKRFAWSVSLITLLLSLSEQGHAIENGIYTFENKTFAVKLMVDQYKTVQDYVKNRVVAATGTKRPHLNFLSLSEYWMIKNDKAHPGFVHICNTSTQMAEKYLSYADGVFLPSLSEEPYLWEIVQTGDTYQIKDPTSNLFLMTSEWAEKDVTAQIDLFSQKSIERFGISAGATRWTITPLVPQ